MGGLMIIRRDDKSQTPKPSLPEPLKIKLFQWLDRQDQFCNIGYAWMYQESNGEWCLTKELWWEEEDSNGRCTSITVGIASFYFECGYDYDEDVELPSRNPDTFGYYASSINDAISEWAVAHGGWSLKDTRWRG
jgi:hypothetical protein